MDYSGKIIRANPVTPTQTSASGVWTLDDAAAAVRNNSWPIVGVPNPISKSLRFNSADSAYLNRTPGSAGNRKTWTWSAWVKRSALSSEQCIFSAYTADTDAGYTEFRFLSGDTLALSSFGTNWRITTQVFRDPSAFYHIVIALDTTQATANDRVKVYVNGIQVTAFGTSNNPTQNSDWAINDSIAHSIGRRQYLTTNYFNGYMAEMFLIDGQALTPSSFGQSNPNTGVWEPKPYTGTYGGNGFYLNFSDSSSVAALGNDYSGNNNDWTPNNFSVTAGAGNDSLTDVPTRWVGYSATNADTGGVRRGNYCTLNPLWGAGTLSNGNLDCVTGVGGDGRRGGTIGMSSGKWYCEVVYTDVTGAGTVGIAPASNVATTSVIYEGWAYLSSNGYKYTGGSGSAYGATWTTNDVIGIAFDADAGTLTFYKNGSSQGTAFTGLTSGPYLFSFSDSSGSDSTTYNVNFGQRPFAYTPPAGYVSLCTTNLPTPTIGATSTTQAGNYFNTVLYTGTGSSLGVTGVGFQPDFVWIKGRSGATDHGLYDAVRGVQNQLESNNGNAATTESTGLTAFNTDGFTVGALAQLNTSTATYVGWNWKGNGAGSSNTAGTRTSTVSVSTTSGFSIVTYTGNVTAGATVGHGLGVAPQMIIVKERGNTRSWIVYHISTGATKFLALDTTDAAQTYSGMWNDTAPSSTVFTIGSDNAVNNNSGNFLAYCFAPVAGYSAFGSYTGNASTDGPFVYTGFRPEYILVKATSTVGNWQILDTARNPFNGADKFLRANTNIAEATNYPVDILSNGFKLRNTDSDYNGNTTTYIYMALAENPFKYSLAR